MIKIQIIGNVGKDAEIKEINNKKYASFSVAYELRKGETKWVNVLKNDPNGNLCQYISKGTKLYIDGIPTLGAYVSKNNEAIADMTIWSDRLEFCGGSKQADNTQTQQQMQYAQNTQPQVQQRNDDEDLPF